MWERYNSVSFFEKFIFGLGGITAGAGIVLFEERVEKVCEVCHERPWSEKELGEPTESSGLTRLFYH